MCMCMYVSVPVCVILCQTVCEDMRAPDRVCMLMFVPIFFVTIFKLNKNQVLEADTVGVEHVRC